MSEKKGQRGSERGGAEAMRARIVRGTAAALALVALVAASCDSASPGYRTFTAKKGCGHYSFEYPADFKKSGLFAYDNHTQGAVYHPRLQDERVRASIGVYVYDTSEGPPNAEAKKAAELGRNSQLGYELLEQRSMAIGGVEADYRVYKYDHPGGSEVPIPPHTEIERQVFLVVDGDLWQITMQADELTYELYVESFDHVLETFRILE